MIGDSHARMLIPALLEVAADRDMALAVAFGRSCPWQDGLLAGEPGDKLSPQCAARRPVTYGTRVNALDPDLIVLVGFPRSIDIGGVYTDREHLHDLDRRELVRRTTTDSVVSLVRDGHRVLVVEPLPVLAGNPLSCLSAADDGRECTFAPVAEGVEESLERALAEQHDGLTAIDLDNDVCPGEIACPAIIDGVIVRRDRHHLTPEFALALAPTLDDHIDKILSTS